MRRLYIVLTLFVSSSLAAHAHERIYPETAADIALDATAQESEFIEGMELAFIDRAAVVRRFPSLAALDDHALERWAIAQGSWITRAQKRLIGIRNTAFTTDPTRTRTKYRQGGRSSDMVVYGVGPLADEPIGVINLKGDGQEHEWEVDNQVMAYHLVRSAEDLNGLVNKDHSDGLMSFGESIAELTRQKAVQLELDRRRVADDTHEETNETLFILRAPFFIIRSDGQLVRAAFHVREASFARGGREMQAISGVLEGSFERSIFGAIIDYGIALPVMPTLAHNFVTATGDRVSTDGKAWVWGHQTAEAYDRGHRNQVYLHLREMTGPLEDIVEPVARPLSPDERAWAEIRSGEPISPATRSIVEKHLRGGYDERQRVGVFVSRMTAAQLADLWNGLERAIRPALARACFGNYLTPTIWRLLFPLIQDRAVARSAALLALQMPARHPEFDAREAVWSAFVAAETPVETRMGLAEAMTEEGKGLVLTATERAVIEAFALARLDSSSTDLSERDSLIEMLGRIGAKSPNVIAGLERAFERVASGETSEAVAERATIAITLLNKGVARDALVRAGLAGNYGDRHAMMTWLGQNPPFISPDVLAMVVDHGRSFFDRVSSVLLAAPTLNQALQKLVLASFAEEHTDHRGIWVIRFVQRWQAALVIAARPEFNEARKRMALAFMADHVDALYDRERLVESHWLLSQGGVGARAVARKIADSTPYQMLVPACADLLTRTNGQSAHLR